MKIYPFKATHPNFEQLENFSNFLETIKEKYSDYKNEGLFQKEEKNAMYIQRIEVGDNISFGLIACTHIEEYLNENIKKHEKTIVNNEEKHLNLLQRHSATIKPILLALPMPSSSVEDAVSTLDKFMKIFSHTYPPFYQIVLNEKHTFWQVYEAEHIEFLQQLFSKITTAYICDGHHRSASLAANYGVQPNERNSKLFCAFYPRKELTINAFHRILYRLSPLEVSGLLVEWEKIFDVQKLENAQKPTQKFELTAYCRGIWYQLNWKQTVVKNFEQTLGTDKTLLDVDMLNELIFKKMFGITNIRISERISYVEGAKSLSHLQKLTDMPTLTEGGIAFVLYPVRFQDLQQVSDTNGTMPPKSTFFEPRMKNGLLVYDI